MALLNIFANFFIDTKERYLRMQDSFRSFGHISADKWVVNARGRYAKKTMGFLRENLGDQLIAHQLQSQEGWFHDTRQMLPDIDGDYVLFWIEDHINLAEIDLLENIVSEMQENDLDYMMYTFWQKGLIRERYRNIPLTPGWFLDYFEHNITNNPIIQANIGGSYLISAASICKRSLFNRIVLADDPIPRRWPEETPFDFEKAPDDTHWLPIKVALTRQELFASIDCDHGCEGSCLQARGLYPVREKRKSYADPSTIVSEPITIEQSSCGSERIRIYQPNNGEETGNCHQVYATQNKNMDKFSCLFLNAYYPAFINNHYNKTPELQGCSYIEQKRAIYNKAFGDSDFYSTGLKKVGWDADEIIFNCSPLQQAWGHENGFQGNDLEIAIEQIRRAKPQVVYIQDMNEVRKDFLEIIQNHTELIAGQIATTIGPNITLPLYDIIFSSFPHYVKRFRTEGLTAYYQLLAFDPRVLEDASYNKNYSFQQRPIACSFVGGISSLHVQGNKLLEALAYETPIEIWGYGSDTLPPNSLLRNRHRGEAWGKEMVGVLCSSKITVNRHAEYAENFANNVRLFEATGCGALLITDYKDNLKDLFEIGKEIVAYHSPEECASLVNYYLDHPDEAEIIAAAGQRRTLNEHTYTKRMEITAKILERRLLYKQRKKHIHQSDGKKNKPVEKPCVPLNLISDFQNQYKLNMTSEFIIVNRAMQLIEYAIKYLEQQDYSSALNMLNESMYYYPKIENLQFSRAICLEKLCRFDEALIAAQAELNLFPGNEKCLGFIKTYHRGV